MHGLPQPELPDQKEQEEHPEAPGTPKVLQILQKENFAQGNQIVFLPAPGPVLGASYNGSTAVSKTACVGSIPTAPAKETSLYLEEFFCRAIYYRTKRAYT